MCKEVLFLTGPAHRCEDLSVSKIGFGNNIQSLIVMCNERKFFSNDLIARDPDHDDISLSITQGVLEEFGMGQVSNPMGSRKLRQEWWHGETEIWCTIC